MIDAGRRSRGFTLIELITIILLIGVIAVVATAKWPGDMQGEAAGREFKRALRYAQHQAMTRAYIVGNPWGLVVNAGGNRYSIQRFDGSEVVDDFNNRPLLDDGAITIATADSSIWFNGLGEPITPGGTPLILNTNFTIAGTEDLFVCQQTGYVTEGGACP